MYNVKPSHRTCSRSLKQHKERQHTSDVSNNVLCFIVIEMTNQILLMLPQLEIHLLGIQLGFEIPTLHPFSMQGFQLQISEMI
jgi:hypothetical protein